MVGFDVVFAERDESADISMLNALASGDSDEAFRRRLEELAPQLDRDRIFADALAEGPVILGYYFDTNEEKSFQAGELPFEAFTFSESMADSVYLPSAHGYQAPLPVLMQSAYSGGFVSNPLIDTDGIVRRAPLLHEFELNAYESLALAVGATYFNDITLPVFVETSAIESGYPPLEGLELAGNHIPIDSQGAVLVPYRGPAGSFPYVSANAVIEGTLEDAEVLRDAIVLVGATAPGMGDLRSTPFGSIYPGVEVHANVIAGILDNNFRWQPAYTRAAELLAVVVFGLIAGLCLPLLSPIWSTVSVFGLMAAALAFNFYLWEVERHVLPLAATIATLFGIFLINMVFGYVFESRTRSQMNSLFGQYVPPDLVREMAHDPQHYSLASEKREMSVLFSDIRGFTSLSEGLEPVELSELMNQYLTPMTKVVHEARGTIDKYIGDAIMAFWGAPIEDDRHAYHAVLAGLHMLEALTAMNKRFREENFPEIHIGVGINTGFMSVGNMGSEFRRAYTVLGDSVNLGSRLEGLTKVYGVGIIVSEETAAKAPEFFYHELDKVRVKGKVEPVTIFEAIGLHEELDQEHLDRCMEFRNVVKLYREQNWKDAASMFEKFHEHDRFSVLSKLYYERTQHFHDNPPGDDWDGVFTHLAK
ncbi:CHASE2 domain-containing protein [Candidatus Leptofilum sp.]|uniref:CHASE2 domain-containing protein n=1 Tax=Candidatus Leptofilum sp. TaxID=3241576 RepID=UPI003B596554